MPEITHASSYCNHCETEIIICGKCGNNCCNGGHGELLDGSSCDACSEAYEVQRKMWEDLDRDSQYGVGKTIISDKCDSGWTDVDCPRPATWAKVHYGQFGHTVLRLYCDVCRELPETRGRRLLRAIFNEPQEDEVWEPYEEFTNA